MLLQRGKKTLEMLKSRLWCCYVGFWSPHREFIKCFFKSLRREQILITTPRQGEISAQEGEVRVTLELSPEALWLSVHMSMKNKTWFFLLFCQHYCRYFSQRQENRTSLFLCRSCSFLFFVFLSINHTLHRNENYSAGTHKSKDFQKSGTNPICHLIYEIPGNFSDLVLIQHPQTENF